MEDIAKMTGQKGEDRIAAYKLNEVRMNGDDGSFTMMNLLAGKGEDGKYEVKPVGETFAGVVLKMCWRLFKYEENGDGSPKVTSTSEYDNKNTDKVVVFGINEKGLAADMKVKYNLGSQRILYVYVPLLKEVVRVIVKASALSGDKNPQTTDGREMGLFEYVDAHNGAGTYLHECLTNFGSIFREDAKNKRKSYFATTFKTGRALKDEEKSKVLDMIKDIHSKTSANPNFADEYVETAVEETIEYPSEDINPDDIPF